MRTPWGPSQSVRKLGTSGIRFVSTEGHGGFYVPDELLKRITVKEMEYAEKWSGSVNWYEEDCAWAIVAKAYPELFDEDELERADSIYLRYILKAIKEDE